MAVPYLTTYTPPSWYISPYQQIQRMRQLNTERQWGFANKDFRVPPKVRLYGTQILLLSAYLPGTSRISGVHRTFQQHVSILWKQGLLCKRSFLQWNHLQTDDFLDVHDSWQSRPGLRWVKYDYAAYYDPKNSHAVDDLWDNSAAQLAASDVMSALVQFPCYGLGMLMGDPESPHANLPGYKVQFGSNRSGTLSLTNWDGQKLGLSMRPADQPATIWSSPTAVEC